jgi:serine/threonine protein kinase
MKSALLKAQAKKKKYLNKKEKNVYDSDESLSSDNEEELSEDMVGQNFNNRYICIKYLGRGTFSTVWLFYDITDNIFKVAKHHTDENTEEYKNELRILLDVNKDINENIIKYYDHFTYSKHNKSFSVIIIELLGITLLDVINDIYKHDFLKQQLNENVIKKITKDILNGFKTLHSHSYIHADLKPENILFDILPHKVDSLIEHIKSINPQKIIQDRMLLLLPDNIDSIDKNKRKTIKKKIKLKTHTYLKSILTEQIELFNNNYDSNNDILYDYTKLASCNFVCKIIDLGNAEHCDKISHNELYLRIYRPPENIITQNYNTKADIWVIGCILYELVTGFPLFDFERTLNDNEKNRDHLYQMFKIMGSMNQNMIDRSDFYDEFFNYKGKLEMKHLDKRYISCLEDKIIENSFITNTIFNKDFTNLLNLMFEYNLNMRANAETLLRMPFLK